MFRDTFTTEEWQTLQFAPFWIGVAVAGADQNAQPEESAVLAEDLAAVRAGAKRYDDPFVQEVFESVARDFADIGLQCLRDGRALMKGLEDVANVLDQHATREQGEHFKAVLLDLGIRTAEAAGKGGFLERFHTDKASDEEKATIVAAALALRFDLSTIAPAALSAR